MLQLLSMSVKKRTTGQLMIVQTQQPTFNVQQEKQMSPSCYSTSSARPIKNQKKTSYARK